MRSTRRDLITIAAGGAAGLLFTPVPYKLIDDISIWTQNWSWMPRLPRGEVAEKYAACTLCSVGCGVRIRFCGEHPFGMTGPGGHPWSQGVCATGAAAYQLPYHPARLRATQQRGRSVPLRQAVESLRKAGAGLVIFDCRPDRATSELYRRFAAEMKDAQYVTPPAAEEGMLRAVARRMGRKNETCGADFESARFVLSVNAPVWDNWGAPARLRAVREKIRWVHAGARLVSALAADEYIPLKPGSEAAFALALAKELLASGRYSKRAERCPDLADFRALVSSLTAETAETLTGVAAERIRRLAEELVENAPALVIAGGDAVSGPLGAAEEAAFAALNLLLGNAGTRGGILLRETWEGEPAPSILELPERSVRALLIDAAPGGAAVPWPLIQSRLASDAVVVCLSPFATGYARRADFAIPAPVFLESPETLGPPPGATANALSVSPALLPKPDYAVLAEDLLAELASAYGVIAPGTLNGVIDERVTKIHARRRGGVVSFADGTVRAVAEFDSASALRQALEGGACWVDELAGASSGGFQLLPESAAERELIAAAAGGRWQPRPELPLVAVACGDRGATGQEALSPLLTKLYQESGLRLETNRVLMNPTVAEKLGIEDGALAELQTSCGACRVRVHLAPSVMHGVVEAFVGPSRYELAGDSTGPEPRTIDICAGDGIWRAAPARLTRV